MPFLLYHIQRRYKNSQRPDFMAFIIIKLFVFSETQTLSVPAEGKLAFSSRPDKVKEISSP
jgi:hypothetical protein